ncbi:hypothetical protein FDUTEX481_06297 [Tolypothrix sp. PCC 7601]|nr:hypothetical protein FDUTEX481_06297 [Tolypothrix sp. PCC 7601]
MVKEISPRCLLILYELLWQFINFCWTILTRNFINFFDSPKKKA